MRLPNVLTIHAFESETKVPIPNVAFVMVLRSLKNDYFVGPIITDMKGECAFTIQETERYISATREMFIMDYAGDLSDCKQPVEIRLHEPGHIRNMINQFRKTPAFWGKPYQNPEELFRGLEKVENDLFKPFRLPCSEGRLHSNATLDVRLFRK